VTSAVDTRPGEDELTGAISAATVEFQATHCDRGHVIASTCIHTRIPFVWFATRRALLGGD
jgi:hypothetical protein